MPSRRARSRPSRRPGRALRQDEREPLRNELFNGQPRHRAKGDDHDRYYEQDLEARGALTLPFFVGTAAALFGEKGFPILHGARGRMKQK